MSWEVYIGSWIQQKWRANPLKKATCGVDLWCVFCVHNELIPLLEWYNNEQHVLSHRPDKVLDLLDCTYVSSSIEDDRTFVIGFRDSQRPVVELATLTTRERDDWISMLSSKLTQLGCLDTNSNVYSSMPEVARPNPYASHVRLSDLFPLPSSPPASPNLNSSGAGPIAEDAYEHICQGVRLNSISAPATNDDSEPRRSSTAPRSPKTPQPAHSERPLPPPPLPPRQLSADQVLRRMSQEDTSNYNVPSPRSKQLLEAAGTSIYDCPSPRATQVQAQNGLQIPEIPRRQTSTSSDCSLPEPDVYENIAPRAKSASPDLSEYADRYDRPNPRPITEDDIVASLPSPRPQAPRAVHHLDSPVPLCSVDSFGPIPVLPARPTRSISYSTDRPDSRASTISATSIASNFAPRKLSLKEREVMLLREQIQCGSVNTAVPIRDAVDGLALVQFDRALWVAGWNQKCYKRLSAAFHFGDQILTINDIPVASLTDAENAFYETTPGSDVQFLVRRLPYGRVFAMKRQNEGQTLGIERDGGKNTIIDVEHGSLAHQAGLTPSGSSYFDPARLSPWVITEVNGRPVNVFSRNHEAAHRLKAIGLDISVVVQPKDLVKKLKEQLKTKKNWKQFLV